MGGAMSSTRWAGHSPLVTPAFSSRCEPTPPAVSSSASSRRSRMNTYVWRWVLYLLWIHISCCQGSSNIRQFKILHDVTFHNTLPNTFSVFPQATTPPQHIFTIQHPCARLCRVRVLSCACVCLFTVPAVPSGVTLFGFLKSDSTACLNYLMWNRDPCSHGSM